MPRNPGELAEFMGWCRAFLRLYRELGYDPLTGRRQLRLHVRHRHRDDACAYCADCARPIVLRRDLVARHGSSDFGCYHCDKCHDCCSCTQCTSCGRVSTPSMSLCEHCEHCERCCECIFCSDCGRECGDDYCGECRECSRCCGCSSGDCNVRHFTNALRFWPARPTQRKLNPSPRYISAEIEVASIDTGSGLEDTVNAWHGSIVEDGSLPESGFEINTAPAGGDKFVQQVTEICRRLSAGGAEVTSACGLHVHVDARSFNHYDIRRLIKVYAVIEPALYGMVSPSRRESDYCKPCGARYLRGLERGEVTRKIAKEDLDRVIYNAAATDKESADNLKRRKQNKYEGARYYALNLHSWFYRGTVECRMFNGTANADKIINWGMLWARILDYVAAHTDKDLEGAALIGTPYEVLRRIAELPRLQAFIEERTNLHSGPTARKEAA